jgi:hypothetical protein
MWTFWAGTGYVYIGQIFQTLFGLLAYSLTMVKLCCHYNDTSIKIPKYELLHSMT